VKIATRLTILLVILTTMVALSVGWFAVAASSRTQYAALNGEINAVVVSGIGTPNVALSNALNVAQQNNFPRTLDVVDRFGGVVQINTGTVAPKGNPTLADAKSALKRVTGVENLPGFRIRSLNIGGGDFLVVAGSTSTITKQNQRLALQVGLVGLFVAIVMLMVARFVMRNDLSTMERLIDYASHVARGDEQREIPPSAGSRDIRELQSALATMVDALRKRIAIEIKSVEVMQQFIGDASHELRTPLTVIKGYNELMENPTISEEQRLRAVERVHREIDRMDSLVADLLLSAEIREAPQHFDQSIDLSSVVLLRSEEFESDSPSRPLTLNVEKRLRVLGRDDLLNRLLTNAFSNIVRYTDDGTPVLVELRRAGVRVILRIEDGGKGLPSYGERPQRFRRFDESRSRETGGSGLGMSIMADIVEGLNGTLVTEKSSLGGLALIFTFSIESLA
jgi:two-component system OmpR family sensor kinase